MLDGIKQKCRTNDEDLFRKGRLSYDRHWGEREASVERVLKEVSNQLLTESEKEFIFSFF